MDVRIAVQLDRIVDNPFQTRTAYDPAGILELAEDIKRNGLQQLPVGRVVDADGKPADCRAWDARGGRVIALKENGNRSRGTTKDRCWLFIPMSLHRIG